jgi:putative PEP-CTERM system TPR-repeat lipoprotein
MRFTTLGSLGIAACLALWPIAAQADALSNARAALKKGDLRAAQIELRNAVRNDPQNAEAHFLLARVSIELGDPVASERAARSARERGYDPAQTVPLLAQSLLAQNKFDALLETLKPEGRNAALDASVLVYRGYAELGLRRAEDAQQSFAEAQRVAPNAVEPMLADARLAIARADLATAEARIEKALAAQPKSSEAAMAKAQLLRLKNDANGAIAVLDELIKDQPSVTQARLDRASLALALGKSDVAKTDIDAVLKGTPGNVQALYLRAVLSAQARNFKAADADLERISAFLPRIQRAFYLQAVIKEQLGQHEQAEEAARKYLGRNANDLAGYKVLARIQAAKRRPDLVIDTLAKVAETGRGDAETFDLLGRAYAATGRSADAVKNFERAQALAPQDVGLQTRLASVRMGMGDVETAVGDLEQTLQLAPKVPAVGEALFFAALATGDPRKVQDALAKIRAAQGDTEIVGNLEGLFRLAMIDVPAAQAIFDDLVKKFPDLTPGRVNLARTLLMMGKAAEGEKLLADQVAKQPATDPALGMLIAVYNQTGRQSEAVRVLERAVAAEPNSPRLRTALGELYIRSGNAQKALELVNKDKGASATSTDVLSLRAAAQLALGQKKEAQTTYAELLKADPNVLGARRQQAALLIEAGEFETARNVLQGGIAAAPRNYQLYQDYLLIDLRASGIDAALASADRLVSQDREYDMLTGLKGDVYMAANRPRDALQAYQDAFQTRPSTVLVSKMSGAAIRSGQTDEAIRILTDWSRRNPQDVGTPEQLAEIYLATNRLTEAIGHLENVLKQKPYEAVSLNNLAWAYQQTGDRRAYDLARQAYLLQPGPQTVDTLGWILVTSGRPEVGLMLLRQAFAEGSTDARIQYHYGIALRDTGNMTEAVKHLKAVAEARGEFHEKREAQRVLEQMKKGG